MSDKEHDRFFRTTFKRRVHAMGLLQPLLPRGLRERIDWRTLRLESSVYVDETSSKCSDLVFSVRTRDGLSLLLLLLIEHQSSLEALMALRMAGYMVRALEGYVQANPGCAGMSPSLPAVLPLVVSHCERPWSASLELRELYNLDPQSWQVLAPYQLNMRYLVDDLVGQTPEDIRRRQLTVGATLTLLALRSVRFSKNFHESAREWADLLQQLPLEELGPFLRYALRVGEGPPEALRDMLCSSVSSEAGELVMTTAERLIKQGLTEGLALGRIEGLAEGRVEGLAEGRVEGLAEGRVEGLAEGRMKERERVRRLLLSLLRVRFPEQPIPAALQQRIDEGEVEVLARWHERVLQASTLLDVFADEAGA